MSEDPTRLNCLGGTGRSSEVHVLTRCRIDDVRRDWQYFLLLQKAWLLGEELHASNDPDRLAKLSRIEKVSELVLSKFSGETKTDDCTTRVSPLNGKTL